MATFELISLMERPTAVVHAVVPMTELPQFIGRAFAQVFEALRAQGVPPLGAPFARYFGRPSASVEIEAGVCVEKPFTQASDVKPGTLPGGRCIHGIHIGRYEQMERTYDALQRWAEAEQLKLQSCMWEIYLSDPQSEPDPEKWRTEIYWPVE